MKHKRSVAAPALACIALVFLAAAAALVPAEALAAGLHLASQAPPSAPWFTSTGLAMAAAGAAAAAPDEIKAALSELTKATTTALGEVRTEVKTIGERVESLESGTTERIDGIEKKLNRPGFVAAPEKALADERKAVSTFVRVGSETEMKAMSVGSDPDGGYLVHPVLSASMTKKLFDATPMRRLARVETITAGDAFEEPLDIDQVGAGWVAETEGRPETSTPQVGVLRVPVEEIYAMPKVSQRMIDDSQYDIAAWLEGKVSDRFGRIEGAATVLGDGIKKPRGFLTYPTSPAKDDARPWNTLQTFASGAATDITPDGLKGMVWGLRAPYRQGATWLMNSATGASIDKMKDTSGAYLWREALVAGAPPTLLGYPVEFSEDMPDVAAGSLPIAFGNWKLGYLIVDKAGIRWLRDPYSAKPWLLVYAYKRVGGAVANSEAIKLLRVSAS